MIEPAIEGIGDEEALRVTLLRHAQEAAARATAKLGGPLTAQNLDAFLSYNECVKYPTVIVYDEAPLEPHQFAQPVVRDGKCLLHVHPHYANRPECVPIIAAYMAGAINYGAVATLDVCEAYGAGVTCLSHDEFYRTVCQVADELPLDLLLST